MPVLPAGAGSSMFTGTVTVPSLPTCNADGMLTVGSGPLAVFVGLPGKTGICGIVTRLTEFWKRARQYPVSSPSPTSAMMFGSTSGKAEKPALLPGHHLLDLQHVRAADGTQAGRVARQPTRSRASAPIVGTEVLPALTDALLKCSRFFDL